MRHAFNKVSIHLIVKADAIPFDLKDERTIAFDLSDLDSINLCKDELNKFVGVILKDKVQYSSPVFRTLGVAAATAEEKEGFLEKISDQIESIAADVSSIDSTILMSDIDKIDSIKDAVELIEKQHAVMTGRFDGAEKLLREILGKLER